MTKLIKQAPPPSRCTWAFRVIDHRGRLLLAASFRRFSDLARARFPAIPDAAGVQVFLVDVDLEIEWQFPQDIDIPHVAFRREFEADRDQLETAILSILG